MQLAYCDVWSLATCVAVLLGEKCVAAEDCMVTVSNRSVECWQDLCLCPAGFRSTHDRKDCVQAGKTEDDSNVSNRAANPKAPASILARRPACQILVTCINCISCL
jgi:hypothetical protein